MKNNEKTSQKIYLLHHSEFSNAQKNLIFSKQRFSHVYILQHTVEFFGTFLSRTFLARDFSRKDFFGKDIWQEQLPRKILASTFLKGLYTMKLFIFVDLASYNARPCFCYQRAIPLYFNKCQISSVEKFI